MKKMIPVYVMLFAMLGTFVFVGYKALQKLDRMNATLIRIQMDQGGPMEVEVVNTPTVEIEGTVDVSVTNEPLGVSIR